MDKIMISKRLQEWLQMSQSPTIQAAVENDFNQVKPRAFLDSEPPIENEPPGAGPEEE